MTTQPDPYLELLRRKMRMSPLFGFEVDPSTLTPEPVLKPHIRAIVPWAVWGGRRALFLRFGLGKTRLQLEIMRVIQEREGGPCLIVLPLGIRQEFARDAAVMGLEVRFIRTPEEMSGLRAAGSGLRETTREPIYLTNYESVRDGKLDPNIFRAVSLDEASVLRSYGSKTYQTFLTLFEGVKYRFVATATPSPNRTKELIHYAGFLGVMDTGQALTRWFQRNSEKANELTLYPHKEKEFWLWVHSWAIFLQWPSEICPCGCHSDGHRVPGIGDREELEVCA